MMSSLFLRTTRWLVVLSLSSLFLGDFAPANAELAAETEAVDFARVVLPILSDKCFVCHGPDGNNSDVLRLDSFGEATKDLGGYRAINSEIPEESELLMRIHSSKASMPPKDAEKQLTPEERETLTRWIHQGGSYSKHWAFVSPRKTELAEPAKNSPSDAIDMQIEAVLKKQGVDFAPSADRATLARRVSLVLTGLPPEPTDLAKFLADDSPNAYEMFVDRLLASPRYGEHQARYWLDAVRYGDTHGLHLDNRRGIFPYRDWVIHALNKNLPFDDFITWQLAGDLLPNATLEQQVATGFVRMNPTTSEGGVIPAEFQAKNNFDRVETIGTVFLGMTLTCARCHTHKYDPIPQEEYYELFAFFNSTAESPLDGNKYEYAPVVKAPANVRDWEDWSNLQAEKNRLVEALTTESLGRREGDSRSNTLENTASTQQTMEKLLDPNGPFAATRLHQHALDWQERMSALEESYVTTLVAKELPVPRVTKVLERGEYDMPVGKALEPDTFSILNPLPTDAPRNRLSLARWLTSRDNPLVSRVLVNRVWQRTFGYGLVRTPEDFGLQGEQPTHPELLDLLAVEFQESGWDLKQLLRTLVTTRTFRQSSGRRHGIDDPSNRLLARGPRHRLDAEVIRDVALWASDLMDTGMGGAGVKPYQPPGLWSALMHPASNTKKYERDRGNKIYRRSLYVYWKRTSPHPMLTLFDAPSRESSCVRRSRTNTSLQSLALFNETQRVEMARALAERLMQTYEDDHSRLTLLFSLLACRPPTDVERSACEVLLAKSHARFKANPADAAKLLSIGDTQRNPRLDSAKHAAWTQVTVTVLASDVAILLY